MKMSKLSAEEKQSVQDYFDGQDKYNPNKDSSQEPHDYEVKGFCKGGMCTGGHPGYCHGGAIKNYDEGGPVQTPLTDDDKQAFMSPSEDIKDAPNSPPEATAPPSHTATPQAASSPLDTGQFNELIQFLSQKPTAGQAAAQGVAGLGDAIMQGVARAGNPGFQKNIMEQNQEQKQNLINALRAKYEAGYKPQELALQGQRLGEEARHNVATEQETAKERETQAKSLAQQVANQNLERQQVGEKAKMDAAQKVVEAYEKGAGLWGTKLGQSRPSDAEYNSALQVLKSSGTAGGTVKTATNPTTGQKIITHDGGKTWQKI